MRTPAPCLPRFPTCTLKGLALRNRPRSTMRRGILSGRRKKNATYQEEGLRPGGGGPWRAVQAEKVEKEGKNTQRERRRRGLMLGSPAQKEEKPHHTQRKHKKKTHTNTHKTTHRLCKRPPVLRDPIPANNKSIVPVTLAFDPECNAQKLRSARCGAAASPSGTDRRSFADHERFGQGTGSFGRSGVVAQGSVHSVAETRRRRARDRLWRWRAQVGCPDNRADDRSCREGGDITVHSWVQCVSSHVRRYIEREDIDVVCSRTCRPHLRARRTSLGRSTRESRSIWVRRKCGTGEAKDVKQNRGSESWASRSSKDRQPQPSVRTNSACSGQLECVVPSPPL